MDTLMAQQVQTQSALDYDIAGSNLDSASRMRSFLSELDSDKKGDDSDIRRKLTANKILTKKLEGNVRKMKQRIKEQYRKLQTTLQQIENLSLEALKFEKMLEEDDDMDVK